MAEEVKTRKEDMAVHYYTEDCDIRFPGKRKTGRWIDRTIAAEGRETGQISIVFCSDDYLLALNRKHLNHDYFTDIITFDYDEGETVSGDLFISIDTVRANAVQFGVSFPEELYRVIIHGVLHLCGYKDKTPEDSRLMREKENYYLSLREETEHAI